MEFLKLKKIHSLLQIENNMKVKIRIGGQTMLGVISNSLKQGIPITGGNCFDLIDDDKSHRVVNFCVENFKYITEKLNLTYIYVDLVEKSDTLWIIKDYRIPQEWYSKEYCIVCTPIRMLPTEQRKKYLSEHKFKKYTDESGTSWTLIKSKEPKWEAGLIYAP